MSSCGSRNWLSHSATFPCRPPTSSVDTPQLRIQRQSQSPTFLWLHQTIRQVQSRVMGCIRLITRNTAGANNSCRWQAHVACATRIRQDFSWMFLEQTSIHLAWVFRVSHQVVRKLHWEPWARYQWSADFWRCLKAFEVLVRKSTARIPSNPSYYANSNLNRLMSSWSAVVMLFFVHLSRVSRSPRLFSSTSSQVFHNVALCSMPWKWKTFLSSAIDLRERSWSKRTLKICRTIDLRGFFKLGKQYYGWKDSIIRIQYWQCHDIIHCSQLILLSISEAVESLVVHDDIGAWLQEYVESRLK